jgi:hypothetical protein
MIEQPATESRPTASTEDRPSNGERPARTTALEDDLEELVRSAIVIAASLYGRDQAQDIVRSLLARIDREPRSPDGEPNACQMEDVFSPTRAGWEAE